MKGHVSRKNEELIYGEDFVVVPKYVFKSLSKWYPCNKMMGLYVKKSENYGQVHPGFKISRMDTTGNVAEPATPEQQLQKSNFSTNIHAYRNEEVLASPVDDNVQIDKPIGEVDIKKENGNYDTNATQHGGSEFRIMDDKFHYELEIYPITIYFALIESDGKRHHQACVKDNKIDWAYMKKHIKSDMIPFREFVTSRHSTFELVL